MKLRAILLSFALIANYAQAASVGTTSTKIAFVSSYNQYGTGDVIFKVQDPVSDCADGYWITKADPGFQANLAMIISASEVKNTVVVNGLPDQLWSGSTDSKYCKLYSIEFH